MAAAGVFMATTSRTGVHPRQHSPFDVVPPKPTSLFPPSLQLLHPLHKRKTSNPTVRSALEDDKAAGLRPSRDSGEGTTGVDQSSAAARKITERFTYLVAAVMSTLGITSTAAVAVYYRFVWQMEGSGDVPYVEMFGTFALSVGAAVGMEFWARWAHRALWYASLWHMHESHHKPRNGAFELNDVFAIINAVPAITLLSYGSFHKGIVPALCFGAGLGITVFGIAYMFIHDGLVHRRFPVGPVADVPYLRRVASAHRIHHSDKFDGVPYGLFLGPKEVERVLRGLEELEKEM